MICQHKEGHVYDMQTTVEPSSTCRTWPSAAAALQAVASVVAETETIKEATAAVSNAWWQADAGYHIWIGENPGGGFLADVRWMSRTATQADEAKVTTRAALTALLGNFSDDLTGYSAKLMADIQSARKALAETSP